MTSLIEILKQEGEFDLDTFKAKVPSKDVDPTLKQEAIDYIGENIPSPYFTEIYRAILTEKSLKKVAPNHRHQVRTLLFSADPEQRKAITAKPELETYLGYFKPVLREFQREIKRLKPLIIQMQESGSQNYVFHFGTLLHLQTTSLDELQKRVADIESLRTKGDYTFK